ncbi:MAG: hypothetical protein QMD65_02465 [Patescibacteria group bacterium]|nr:hypothetical protein [Patescibacteria group bacterium]
MKHNIYLLGIFSFIIFSVLLFIFPALFKIFHHYLNFFAIGRSNTKVFAFILWALFLFTIPFLNIKVSKEFLSKIFNKLLLVSIIISLIGALFSVLIVLKYDLSFKDVIYAVDSNFDISFNHVSHSHLFKPAVGFLSPLASNVDFGAPWFFFFNEYFSINVILLFVFYGLIFLFFVALLTVFALNFLNYQNLFLRIVYILASFSFLKNFIDGGLLNPEMLISLSILLFLIKKPMYILGLLPFLVFDYFIRFSGGFIERSLIQICLFYGLIIFSFEVIKKSDKKLRFWLGAFCVVIFFYSGGAFEFFKQTPLTLVSNNSKIFPAGKTVFFTKENDFYPQKIILSESKSAEELKRDLNAKVEYEFVYSFMVDGVNCNSRREYAPFNNFRILANNSDEFYRNLNFSPWYNGQLKGDSVKISVNECIPNLFTSTLSFIKSRLDDKKIVVFAFRPVEQLTEFTNKSIDWSND